MKKFFALVAVFFVFQATQVMAAVSPVAVTVSPGSATLYFETAMEPGMPATFLVPAQARTLRIEADGGEVVSFHSEYDSVSGDTSNVAAKELDFLKGNLAALTTAEKTYLPTAAMNTKDLAELRKDALRDIPSIVTKEEALERAISAFPDEKVDAIAFNRVTVTVDAKKGYTLRWSYILPDCGWMPVYDFTADIDKGFVDVAFQAEIIQRSGIDWKGAKVTLVANGDNNARLPDLRPWRLEIGAKPVAGRAKGTSFVAMNSAVMSDSAMPETVNHKRPPVTASDEGAFAFWELSGRDVPQGVSRMGIAKTQWKDAVAWVARPGTRGVSDVFMVAEHVFKDDGVWPRGRAEFAVRMADGNIQPTGIGAFAPREGKVTLDFGPDRMMSVDVREDAKKRGEKGIFQAMKTWSWGWTYVIRNNHPKAVRVLVERPKAVAVDESIKVSFQGAPKPVVENTKLVWNVDVPAKGMTDISHLVTVEAPADAAFTPVPPTN